MRSSSVVVKSVILLGLLTFQTLASAVEKTSSTTATTASAAAILSSPDRLTMRDINNAFTSVANASSQIKSLISNMFNLSLTNPAYVFRLPQDGDSYLVMKKSDFVQPIFPNLTASYVRLMQSKRTSNHNTDFRSIKDDDTDLNTVEEDDPTLFLNLQTERNFIEYLSELNEHDVKLPSEDKEENKDDAEWSLLGLDGWKGGLSKPSTDDIKPLSEKSDKTPARMWDLPGKMQQQSLELNLLQAMRNTSILKTIGNVTQSKYLITNRYLAHSDGDVYIGRVNDPFGHSTKWNLKNSSSNEQLADRKKRGVIELYSMIKCSTGCDPIIYKGYGCYCGFLGNGLSMDGIDQCCKQHDKCYEHSTCISYLEYFVPYIWKCYRGKPLCATDHGEWGGPNSCAARLCKCDLTLSRCLRRFVCPQRRAICRSSKARMLQNLLFNF